MNLQVRRWPLFRDVKLLWCFGMSVFCFCMWLSCDWCRVIHRTLRCDAPPKIVSVDDWSHQGCSFTRGLGLNAWLRPQSEGLHYDQSPDCACSVQGDIKSNWGGGRWDTVWTQACTTEIFFCFPVSPTCKLPIINYTLMLTTAWSLFVLQFSIHQIL